MWPGGDLQEPVSQPDRRRPGPRQGPQALQQRIGTAGGGRAGRGRQGGGGLVLEAAGRDRLLQGPGDDLLLLRVGVGAGLLPRQAGPRL
eukprot:scaffold156798_cov34-Prasinocladus_malaysianus.AAC.1